MDRVDKKVNQKKEKEPCVSKKEMNLWAYAYSRVMEMKKADRHALLKKITQNHVVQKQEEFVDLLAKEGVDVTQATVSRDIKELEFTKVQDASGVVKYALPPAKNKQTERILQKKLADSFLKMDTQKEFLLIRTLPGNAVALGSLLEEMKYEEVFGLISGDDTVLVICTSDSNADQLQKKMLHYL